MATNKFGLSRSISAAVKREVRQKCGFGCVVCGLGLYEYEHVDPTFEEARSHDPDNITLLCPTCHARVTRGTWSKEYIKESMEHPKCLQNKFTYDEINTRDFNHFTLAETRISCSTILSFRGSPILQILPPEERGAPQRLTGFFTDSIGQLSLKIEENNWIASADVWDIETVGKSIIIREGKRNICLKIKKEDDGMIIETLNMRFMDWNIQCRGGDIICFYGNRPDRSMTISAGNISGTGTGIALG